MTMSRDEMLAGLRESIVWLSDLDGRYPLSAPKLRELLHAAITALEAAPAQAEAPPSESARTCPVQTSPRDKNPSPVTRIPWSVAERAYASYSARYGRDQTLERLAERGGFSTGELDMFAPGWREEVSEISRLRAELDAERERYRKLSYAMSAELDVSACVESFVEAIRGLRSELAASRAQAEALSAEWYATRGEVLRMREELEQARGEVERLYVAASERDTAREQKRAIRERLREVEQERDASKARIEAYECALESTRVAIERMEQERDAATAEVARLRKLFDDAGQGEHNVLALIDFYQELLAAEEQERDAALAKVADLTTLLGRCRDAGLLPVGIHDDVCAALAELDKEQE